MNDEWYVLVWSGYIEVKNNVDDLDPECLLCESGTFEEMYASAEKYALVREINLDPVGGPVRFVWR